MKHLPPLHFLFLFLMMIHTCPSCGNGKAERMVTWYEDKDHDGYSTGRTFSAADDNRPEGYVREAELRSISQVDCSDDDSEQSPGYYDIPDDGIDQDCTGKDMKTWYLDKDRDGYSVAGSVVYSEDKPRISGNYCLACELFETGVDPDDGNSEVHPDDKGCLADGKVWVGDCSVDISTSALLKGYSEITGNLAIYGLPSEEKPLCPPTLLFSLGCLKKVGGNLDISGLDSMKSPDGLSGLTEVGGSLVIQATSFETLEGLENLTHIGKDVVISGNPNLKTFDGIGTLSRSTEIGESLILINNDSIPDLEGLHTITHIGKNLFIGSNDSMTSLAGLENISEIPGELSLLQNKNLQTLAGSPPLDRIGGLQILSNPSLKSLEGMPQDGLSIDGDLSIANNSSLQSIDGLSSLDIEGALDIENNIALDQKAALALKEFLVSEQKVGGDIRIEKNRDWAENERVFIGDCGISNEEDLSALSGYAIITGMLRIENVSSLTGLETLKRIGKDLIVVATRLADFKGLENLTDIGGDFFITEKFGPEENDPTIRSNLELKSLDGIEHLSSIGGSLTISSNPSLENIDSLKNLKKLSGDINIMSNPSLMHIQGLEGLTQLGGPVFMQSLDNFWYWMDQERSSLETLFQTNILIANNARLTDLNGLKGLSTIPGRLSISGNPKLEIIELDRLESIAGWLGISACDSLSSMSFNRLTSIGERLEISFNSSLESMEGFDNLVSVKDVLRIYWNQGLKAVDGFPALTSIGKELEISCNSDLSVVSGFSNLTSIDGSLQIAANDKLTSLEGFQSLTSIQGTLGISKNDWLSDLEGLKNLSTVGTLEIIGNPSLTRLGLKSLNSAGMGQGEIFYYTFLYDYVSNGFYITQNEDLCDQEAEALLNQVITLGEIGGEIIVTGNKPCP